MIILFDSINGNLFNKKKRQRLSSDHRMPQQGVVISTIKRRPRIRSIVETYEDPYSRYRRSSSLGTVQDDMLALQYGKKKKRNRRRLSNKRSNAQYYF